MKRTLTVLHDIEVFGEALYGTLARLSRNLDRRQSLAWLRELESKTKRTVAGALVEAGGQAHEKLAVRALGVATAAAAAPLPWRWQLRALASLIELGAPLLDKLARSGGVLEKYAAHEAEQLEFFRQQLAQ